MAKKQASGRIPEEVQPAFDVISRMVDDVCREHLNDEYAVHRLKLTEKLARKRPSPLVSGKSLLSESLRGFISPSTKLSERQTQLMLID